MDIEWNTVTWYSKLAAALLFVGVFVLGFYLGTQYAATNGPEKPVAPATTPQVTKSKNTETLPINTKTQTSNKYAAIINLTTSGFVPTVATITVGQTVHFVNMTTMSMRIVSNTLQGAPIYIGFDEQKSVGYGGTFDFLFNQAGEWGFHNLNGDPKIVGTIRVKPQ